MIEKRTVVDQIEITRNGVVQIRLGLLLVEGDVQLACEWHRTVVEPGTDTVAQMTAVNAHLEQMTCKPISPEDAAKIAGHVALAHGELPA